MKDEFLTLETFGDFGLTETLLRAVEARGHRPPTPIQARAIPGLMQHRDMLGIAQIIATSMMTMVQFATLGGITRRLPSTWGWPIAAIAISMRPPEGGFRRDDGGSGRGEAG